MLACVAQESPVNVIKTDSHFCGLLHYGVGLTFPSTPMNSDWPDTRLEYIDLLIRHGSL